MVCSDEHTMKLDQGTGIIKQGPQQHPSSNIVEESEYPLSKKKKKQYGYVKIKNKIKKFKKLIVHSQNPHLL